MRSFAFTVIDNLFVVVSGTASPTDEEWQQYLNAVLQHGIDKTRQLIVADGGGPTSTQRKYLNDLLKGRNVPVAVLTSNVAVRGLTTALGWFNRGVKAFAPADLPSALGHLGLPAFQAKLVEFHIAKLRRQVVVPQAACG